MQPPTSLTELESRAAALSGRSLSELAALARIALHGSGAHTKGKVGELLERLLGATGGPKKLHDFPRLGVELKTIPVDAALRPKESTFVCSFQVSEAEMAEWEPSWVRAKLAHVLWVPIVESGTERRVGAPLFWRPTREQESVLRADFEEAMGLIGIGGIERLDARVGRWLQVRPKARDGTPSAVAYGRDGERIATVPRGFYLRARFTDAILRAPDACP